MDVRIIKKCVVLTVEIYVFSLLYYNIKSVYYYSDWHHVICRLKHEHFNSKLEDCDENNCNWVQSEHSALIFAHIIK